MLNEYVVVKLDTNDEVIGKFVEENDDVIILDRPFVAIPTQQGIQFLPYVMMAGPSDNVSFPRRKITAFSDATGDAIKAYDGSVKKQDQEASGIVMPETPSIIT